MNRKLSILGNAIVTEQSEVLAIVKSDKIEDKLAILNSFEMLEFINDFVTSIENRTYKPKKKYDEAKILLSKIKQ